MSPSGEAARGVGDRPNEAQQGSCGPRALQARFVARCRFWVLKGPQSAERMNERSEISALRRGRAAGRAIYDRGFLARQDRNRQAVVGAVVQPAGQQNADRPLSLFLEATQLKTVYTVIEAIVWVEPIVVET